MKKITNNFFCTILYNFVTFITPLILLPYLTRTIGSNNIGAYNFCDSITQYVIFLGCIGTGLYAQREIAKNQENNQCLNSIFWSIFVIRVLFLTIAAAVYFLIAINADKYHAQIYVILSITIASAAIDISWFFQGIELFRIVALRNIVIKIICIIFVLATVNDENDFLYYVFIMASSNICGNILLWLEISKYIQKPEISFKNIKKYILHSLVLFFPQIAINLYAQLDKVMIGFITQIDAEVAYYSLAEKIIKFPLIIPMSIGSILLSRIAYLVSQRKWNLVNKYIYRSMRIINMLMIPVCFGIVGIGNIFVIWFFGEGYERVFANIIFLFPIVVIIGMSNVIGIQYLLAKNYQAAFTKSVLAGAIINFIINLFLIPIYKSVGASISTVIAEMAVTIIQLYFVRRDLKLAKLFDGFNVYLISGLIMYLSICLMNKLNINFNLIIIISAIAYFGLNLIQRDLIIRICIRIIKKTIKTKYEKI